MEMGVMVELLAPGVQDGQEAKLRTQMLGIARNVQQCLRHALKEEAIEHTRVLQGQGTQRVGEREDHMDVRHMEHLALPGREPGRLGCTVALGTVTIATRVVTDLLVTTLVALGLMAAEHGRATGRHGPQGPLLCAGQAGAIACQKGVTILLHDVRHFERRAGHGRASRAVGSSKVSRGLAVSWAAMGATWR
jgi:hypothetical protein